MNKYVQSVSRTKYSKLEESPERRPRTRVEPTNGLPSTAAERWRGWSELGYRYADGVGCRATAGYRIDAERCRRAVPHSGTWQASGWPSKHKWFTQKGIRRRLMVNCRATRSRRPSDGPRRPPSTSRQQAARTVLIAQTWPCLHRKDGLDAVTWLANKIQFKRANDINQAGLSEEDVGHANL